MLLLIIDKILGVIFLALLAFLEYITITFVIEAQASSNALLAYQSVQTEREIDDVVSDNRRVQSLDARPLIRTDRSSLGRNREAEGEEGDSGHFSEFFSMKKRVEMTQMVDLFLGERGKIFFLVVISVKES